MVHEEGERRGGLLTAPASPQPNAPAVEPRRFGARATNRTISFLLIISTIAVLLQLLWGDLDWVSWYFLSAGVACGIVAMFGWSVLARIAAKRQEHYGVLPWLAFPATLFGSVAIVPLLLLAVYPDARKWLDPQVRIDVHVLRDHLEIVFPRPTRGDAVNVTFDDVSIPSQHFTTFPDDGEWSDFRQGGDNRILSINLAHLQEVFDFGRPRRLGINASLDSSQTHYQSGERILQQWIDIPGQLHPKTER